MIVADVASRVGIDDSLEIGAKDGPAGVEVSLLEGSVVDIPVDGEDGIGVGAADGPVGVKVGFVDGISVGIHVGDDVSPPLDVVFNSVVPYRNTAQHPTAITEVTTVKSCPLGPNLPPRYGWFGFGGANG